MKKPLLLICITLLFSGTALAQWCIPTSLIPYNASMPGITNVTIGAINRTSSDLENYPANSYVNTGLYTNLAAGVTHSISITHTIDGTICPDMNLRVWIDFNNDGQLDDPGETVISIDHHLPGTYTGYFSVPANTPIGPSTLMRVSAKMSDLGGHSLPDPCDIPADPLGYHGEIEDYNVYITPATSITENENHQLMLFPSPAIDHINCSFNVPTSSEINYQILDVTGKTVYSFHENNVSPGFHTKIIPLHFQEKGIYMLYIRINDTILAEKFIKLE